MTRVYGNSIEPGGMELDNERDEVECPECKGKAWQRYWEAAEGGSINQYQTVICTACDYADGDLPDEYYDNREFTDDDLPADFYE